jgi:hypothetical protein
VRDNHLLVEHIVQMLGDPCDLVAPAEGLFQGAVERI